MMRKIRRAVKSDLASQFWNQAGEFGSPFFSVAF
jgi:hypothetical protein